jgi:hypothetical protein
MTVVAMRFQLSSFSFEVPEDWCDITPEDDPGHPFTMALEGGVGAIQVSLVEWKEGERVNINDHLQSMFAEHCRAQGLAIEASAFKNGDVVGIGGSRSTATELTGAWFVTNGLNVALVTYISQHPKESATTTELDVAERLVASARFGDPTNTLIE